eukprot:TRINITY_DN490_c0_g1_i2.p1 TRINITY_DN490_c0_g1~~TRINITY_DN490_c0_g1_i2.p1  ORF type:complete len:194 (-),score=38.28 TRINITY_DN490_c0_g1_i2:25-606(-)
MSKDACIFFKKGNCKNGSLCKFKHELNIIDDDEDEFEEEKEFVIWKNENINEEEKTLEEYTFSEDWDQFKMNEEKFGYISTYDFLNYTVPIPLTLSEEQKMRAQQISLDIENEQTTNLHEAEEKGLNVDRGDDERFSDVARNVSAYFAPFTTYQNRNINTNYTDNKFEYKKRRTNHNQNYCVINSSHDKIVIY